MLAREGRSVEALARGEAKGVNRIPPDTAIHEQMAT